MVSKEHDTDTRMQKLMKLTKSELCEMYITMLNTSDNDYESEELILQPWPTQVLYKRLFQNNYNFKLDSNDDRINTSPEIPIVVEGKIEKDTSSYESVEEISANQTCNKGIANEDVIKKTLESFIDGMIIKARFGSKTDPYCNMMYERIIL